MSYQPSPLFGLKIFVDNKVIKGKMDRRCAGIYMHQQTYNLLKAQLDNEKGTNDGTKSIHL